jgi:putative OmpL-like beta-barrel porin-2
MRRSVWWWIAAISFIACTPGLPGVTPVFAADLKMKKKAPPPPPSWWDTFTINGHVEAGVTFNGNNASAGNFGHLFTDRANSPMLNQALLTIQRPLDPKATGFDVGFKYQMMVGSDARYTHFLGEFDESISGRNQFDIVEAHYLLHLPWLTSGGIDVKVGQYVTLEGAEVIYAPDNLLYTHSYIFNFGIPFKHTGVMTTTHLNPVVDVYAGIDTGVNTTFGNSLNCFNCGDNNKAAAFHGGIGLNYWDGALTILGTTHIGPENPNTTAVQAACACNPNSALRYLNDITTVWKVNDTWTLTNDLNYARDDGFNATGYGVAQYFAYTINDWLKLVGRGEIWRDHNGFFVGRFPGDLDFVKIEHGDPTGVVIGGGATTYGALTLGLNIKPTTFLVWKAPDGMVIRPEIRYDASLNNTTPFGGGTKSSQFTFASDVIIPFKIK